jgi:hypothetical protein
MKRLFLDRGSMRYIYHEKYTIKSVFERCSHHGAKEIGSSAEGEGEWGYMAPITAGKIIWEGEDE